MLLNFFARSDFIDRLNRHVLSGVNNIKFRIISVGKIREKFFRQGIEEYLKRLSAYTKIELLDGLEEKLNPHASLKDIDKLLAREGEKILNVIDQDDIVVLLDIAGQMVNSEQFADHIARFNNSGKKQVNFIIGSSYGISPEVSKRADSQISFSPLTFPHQMAVLILTEQIYRGFKILKGEPYHK